MKQQSLSMLEDRNTSFERPRGRRTRREVFLEQMEQIVPWAELTAVIEPYYPKVGNGRPPIGLERMLRIHFLQHWFNLADEACEDALYDSAAFRSFAGIDLGRERAPDATTLLKFRRLLEQHRLGEALMTRVNGHLKTAGVKIGSGTIVDATIIAAPSSTKNQQKQCSSALARKDAAQWILEGDIRDCYDNISHEWLLQNIPMDKTILRRWLQAGYIVKGTLFATEAGTPHGGVISPVIATMTLDGLDRSRRTPTNPRCAPRSSMSSWW